MKRLSCSETACRKNGQTLVLVLIIILILSTLDAAVLYLSRGRTRIRANLASNIRIFYLADSGIVKAYHMLKKSSWEKRFYAPANSYVLTGKKDGGTYRVVFTDVAGKKQVQLDCEARYGGRKLTMAATATFQREVEVIEESRFHRKRAIRELWKLKYKL